MDNSSGAVEQPRIRANSRENAERGAGGIRGYSGVPGMGPHGDSAP
jgi:hypothetical protein